MMDNEKVKIIKTVYSRLISSEERDWSELDNQLSLLDFMSDKEVVNECEIKYDLHSSGIFRCKSNHDISHCFAPKMLESVLAILELYDETQKLHPKNRYILSFYIGMSDLGLIYLD